MLSVFLHTRILPDHHAKTEVSTIRSFTCITELPQAIREHAHALLARADEIESGGEDARPRPTVGNRFNDVLNPSTRSSPPPPLPPQPPRHRRPYHRHDLSDETLAAIKADLAAGASQTEAGHKYGLPQTTVSLIHRNKYRSLRPPKPKTRPLTDDQVRQIKCDLAAGLTQGAIAKRFNIGVTTVSEIKRGITYSDVR